MQIDVKDFIEMAEKSNSIAFFDLETAGLNADYGTVLVGSIKELGKRPKASNVSNPGDDRDLCVALRDELSKYKLWVSYYGKLFDVKFLNTRLLVHGEAQLPRVHHLDIYWTVRYYTTTARRSQGHIISLLGEDEDKMSVSPDVWASALKAPEANLKKLRARCNSDVTGLEQLYERMKHLVANITR